MIQLGDNIFLKGFESINKPEQLIAKKLIGGYVKKIYESEDACDLFELQLASKDPFEISVYIEVNNNKVSAKSCEQNLFVAIDRAVKKAIQKLCI